MKHTMLAMVLVLAMGGCVNYDEEPCGTLGCTKRVEYRKCMNAFSQAKIRRGYVIILPNDDPMYQMRVCRDRVDKIRVY